MKQTLIAVFAAFLFAPAAFAQAPADDLAAERAFLRPVTAAAKQAAKELGGKYSFKELYARTRQILDSWVNNVKPSKDWAAEQAPWLAGSEEYAASRRAEALMAGAARKDMQKRHAEGLAALKQAGEQLEKASFTFDPLNPKHETLAAEKLQDARLAEEKARRERSKARLKMWLEGLQNSAFNMK